MGITKHILYVGLNDKDTKKQEISTKQAKDYLFNLIGDCTISDATGHYTHDNGMAVLEKSLRIEMLFKKNDEVMRYAQAIKSKLNQESVALEVQEVNSTLI